MVKYRPGPQLLLSCGIFFPPPGCEATQRNTCMQIHRSKCSPGDNQKHMLLQDWNISVTDCSEDPHINTMWLTAELLKKWNEDIMQDWNQWTTMKEHQMNGSVSWFEGNINTRTKDLSELKEVMIRTMNREQYLTVVTRNVCHQRRSREGTAACKGGWVRNCWRLWILRYAYLCRVFGAWYNIFLGYAWLSILERAGWRVLGFTGWGISGIAGWSIN